MRVNNDLPDAPHRGRDSMGIGAKLAGWLLLALGVALCLLLQKPAATP